MRRAQHVGVCTGGNFKCAYQGATYRLLARLQWRSCCLPARWLVQVIPQSVLAKEAALKEYNDAILMQRNRMGEELEQKAEEVERERKQREEVAMRLALLQSKVLLAL